MRAGRSEAGLTVALAAVYDGLLGKAESLTFMREALVFADQAVSQEPASLAAHVARAYLRVHTGDPARARRELEAVQMAAPDSALIQFALAEAIAASGGDAVSMLQRARRSGLPRANERVRASRFLR